LFSPFIVGVMTRQNKISGIFTGARITQGERRPAVLINAFVYGGDFAASLIALG